MPDEEEVLFPPLSRFKVARVQKKLLPMHLRPNAAAGGFPDEVQLLISGGLNEIDINDLRQHTSYNGYSANESYIRDFWAYLEQLPNK